LEINAENNDKISTYFHVLLMKYFIYGRAGFWDYLPDSVISNTKQITQGFKRFTCKTKLLLESIS
jgi:hypothetical protein